LNPDDFWLQTFRTTFATWSLWAGVGPSRRSGMDGIQRDGIYDALPKAEPKSGGAREGERDFRVTCRFISHGILRA
jgi:hypothetical protein